MKKRGEKKRGKKEVKYSKRLYTQVSQELYVVCIEKSLKKGLTISGYLRKLISNDDEEFKQIQIDLKEIKEKLGIKNEIK